MDKKYRLRLKKQLLSNNLLSIDDVVELLNKSKIFDDVPEIALADQDNWHSVWKNIEVMNNQHLNIYCYASGSILSKSSYKVCDNCGRIYDPSFFQTLNDRLCNNCKNEQDGIKKEKELNWNNYFSSKLIEKFDNNFWKVIKSGQFSMGSPPDHKYHESDEILHKVKLSNTFIAYSTCISDKLFNDVMNINNSSKPRIPKTEISWYDAIQFCIKYSEYLDLIPCYKFDFETNEVIWDKNKMGVRLLTEAEWEYACKSGSLIPYIQRTDFEFENFAWYEEDELSEMAELKANNFGLYDMLGNVWEWVWDGKSSFSEADHIDPYGDETSYIKVVKGGSFDEPAENCRCAKRNYFPANHRSYAIGFRVGISLLNCATDST
ncbi:MAG: formylglycine-generating enzyme family protein [Candidatus Delongbacteria bacterium]|nr:formylglycine-generating enzyme family protein [Candidatus Delongbacteria bacterium]